MKQLLVVLALTAACKKSDDGKKGDEPAKPAPAKTEPAKTEPAKTEPAVAPANAAKLATGEALQGCFAWSTKLKAAACIVGEQGASEREISLVYVGTSVHAALADTIDDQTAKAQNEILAKGGYAPIADVPLELAKDTKTALTSTMAILWTMKQTKKGGENVAPSYAGKVVVTCQGKDTTIFEQSEEEGRQLTAVIRTLESTFALVEVKTSLAREGEYGHGTHAFLLDAATCSVVSGE